MADVEKVLSTALAAVNAAEIPDDLRVVAFAKAIDLISGVPTTAGQAAPANLRNDGNAGNRSDDSVTTDNSRLLQIASALGVPQSDIEEFFTEHEGELQITLDPDRLGSSTAVKARTIGILLAVARQIGGYDESATSIETIRAECDRLGIYDSGNFSTQMNDLKSTFIVNGTKSQRTFRVKPSSRHAAKDRIAALTSA